MLGAVGHIANLGSIGSLGVAHAYQKAQMKWAHRAYCLDSRNLRIDLLNAVKEDARDHHQTYANRIDTLLLVHTLLFTFAMGTLQLSDSFLPSNQCVDCEEDLHPWFVTAWVLSVAGILILPFWSIIMLIWSKLQLDQWLETSLGRLNLELRSSLSQHNYGEEIESETSSSTGLTDDSAGQELLLKVEHAVNRLSSFVVEHQESFKEVWNKECRAMIAAATIFLFAASALAIAITAFMFWLFLKNHMEASHKSAATHFAVCTVSGLLAPVVYALGVSLFGRAKERPQLACADDFQDCIEIPASEGASSTDEQSGRLRAIVRRVVDVARRSIGRNQPSSREVFEGDPGAWTQMTDEICPMAERTSSSQPSAE